MRLLCTRSRRLVAISLLMVLFVGISRWFGSFSVQLNDHATVRSWFVEMNLPHRAILIHNKFVAEKLEREIGNIRGVSQVFSITMQSRIVIAFLTDRDADLSSVDAEIRVIANSIGHDGASNFELQSPPLIVSKPADEPLRGVRKPDLKIWSGMGPAEFLRHEIVTLFGENGVYEEEIGLIRHLRGDLKLWLDVDSLPRGDRTSADLITRDLFREFSTILNIQATVLRDFVHRVADFQYSAAEILRLGLTPGNIHRAVSQDMSADANAVSLGKASGAPTVYSRSILPSALDQVVIGEQDAQVRLGDLVSIRPHYMILSGVLGTEMSTWFAKEMDSLPGMERSKSNSGRAYLEIVLRDRQLQQETIREISSRLDKFRSDGVQLQYGIESIDQSDENRNRGLSSLLWLSFFLSILAIWVADKIFSGRYLESFFVSAFMFFGLGRLAAIDLSLERMATALALFAIFSFVRELPNAKQGALKLSRKIQSERMELFLGLLVFPMLLSATVLDVSLTWSERQHILTFVFAALSAMASGLLVGKRLNPKSVSLVNTDWNGLYRIVAVGSVLFMFFPAFESLLVKVEPAGIAFHGRIELGERDSGKLKSLGEFESVLRRLSDSSLQVASGAGPQVGVETILNTGHSDGYELSGALLSDILVGLDPLLAGKLVAQKNDRYGEEVLVRLIDRDLGLHASEASASSYDPLKMRIEQGAIPLHLLDPKVPRSMENASQSGTEIGLDSIVDVVHQEGLVRDLRDHGRSAFLFRGWGEIGAGSSARDAAKSTEDVLRAAAADLNISPEAVEFQTSMEGRETQGLVANRLLWINALLIFVFGAMFFGSLKGGLQTFATFFLCYGFTKPILVAVYVLTEKFFAVSMLEIQIAALVVSIALLCLWGFIAADTNSSRKANLSLQLAFTPIFVEAKKWVKILIGVWSVTLVLGLSLIPFRFFSGILLCAIVALFVFPAWVYFLSEVEEYFYRLYLRARINWPTRASLWGGLQLAKKFLSNGLLFALSASIAYLLWSSEAFAAEVSDTSCQDQVTYILPLLNRPMSVEPVVVDKQMTGLLEAKIPCSVSFSAGFGPIAKILEAARGPAAYEKAVQEMRSFLAVNKERIHQLNRNSGPRRNDLTVRVVAGFVEEIHGFIGLTVVQTAGEKATQQLKFTARAADRSELASRVSRMLSHDERSVLDAMSSRADLIPVAIQTETQESSHDGEDSLRVRGEVYSFLSSRFENPFPPAFLERRQFFRLASEGEAPRYQMHLRVETVGAKIFGSVRVKDERGERTVWIEDDVTNLVQFEEDLLRGSQRALSQLEGIVDYSLVAGLALVGDQQRLSRLFGMSLRQNRGEVAFSGRLRIGKSDGFDSEARPQTLFLVGAAAGYQPLDWRYLNFDVGLGLDAGIAQLEADPSSNEAVTEPNILFSGSLFGQFNIPLPSGFTFGMRIGAEVPVVIETGDSAESTTSENLGDQDGARKQIILGDALFGLGYSF